MKSASHSAILSLVVPVFNVENDLCECLDSIVHQTFKNIEIICVDDGSCDSSPEILRKYAERDSRIKIITQKNQGLSSARNTGVNASRGKYLMFIDSDDYLSPNACKLMVQKILSCDDLAFVSSGTELLWEYEVSEDYKRGKNVYFSKKAPGVYPLLPSEILELPICVCGKIFRLSTIRKNGIEHPVGLKNEDEIFMPQYVQASPEPKFAVIPEKTYFYRQRKNSIMWTILFSAQSKFQPDFFLGLEKLGRIFRRRKCFEKWQTYLIRKTEAAFYQQRRSDPKKSEAYVRILLSQFDFEKISDKEAFPAANRIFQGGFQQRKYPKLLIRILALFIFNRLARKRWRAKHLGEIYDG